MKIDFKHFKKLHSSDKSTTFVHRNGHKIEVAHAGLDKEMLGKLKDLPKFADGGMAGLHEDYSGGNDQGAQRQLYQDNYRKEKSGPDYGKGGQKQLEHDVSKSLGGRHVDLSMPTGMAKGGEVRHYAEGTPEEPVQPQMSLPGNLNEAPAPDYNQMMSPMSPEQAQSEQPKEVQPVNVALPQTPPTQSAPVKGSIMPNGMEGALAQAEQGIRQEANAVGVQGKQEAVAAQNHQNELTQIQDNFNQKSQAIDAERMGIYNDLKNGTIDPNHFVHNMSGFGQAMTAIGLMLGGYGAGINGGSNKAMDFLNNQIDRDIATQKANLGKKESLLSHLNEQFGNLKDATTMAKAVQMDMYSTKMQEVAAQSKNPIAQAEAQKKIAEWHLQYAPQMQELKMRQAILGGMQNGHVSPATAVPWMVPKEHQAKALEEVKESEIANRGLQQVTQAMHDIQKLQGMDRLTSPIQSKSQIDAINLKIDSATKELFGKLSDNELQMMKQSHIGQFDSSKTSQVKLKNIQDMFQKHMSTPTLDAFGIKMPRMNTNVRPNPNAR